MKNHGAFGNFDEARDLGRTTPSYTVTNGTVVASSSVGLYVTGAHAAVDVFGVVSGLGGVLLNGEYASLTNTGTITGVSSYGVDLSGGHGTLINKGVISSGHYGTGAELSGGGMENTGTIDGGGGAYHGGIGIDLSNGIFSNGGTIAGGDTTTTIFGAQAFGGYGAGVTNGTLHNSGLIEGGAGNDGGAGVELDAAKLVNTGTILGGIVKYLFGGTGVAMSNESVLVNHGVIAGSTSQYGDGDGVFLNGGTLTNSGTISASAAAAPADAIRFGSQASTLIIDPGAVFDGTVAANGSNDRLILAKGALAGTMSGLGGQFTGFTTILENAGAHWDISGANTLGADTVFSDAGWLRVSGSLIDNGVIDLSANAVLGVSGAAEVAIGSLNLSGGALLGSHLSAVGIGDFAGAVRAGQISVAQGAVIDGFGEIGGTNVGDDGTILVQGGLLTLNTVVSGTGTLAIASGASVDAQQALRVAHVVFGDAEFGAGGGQLMVTSADAISGTVYQFGVGGGFDDSIDLRGVSATKLQFAGGVLSISDHGSLIGTIAFAGDYSSASFGLSPDGLSGTDISFVMAASSVSMGAAQPEQHNIVAGAWSAWHPGAGLELGGLGIGPVHIPGY